MIFTLANDHFIFCPESVTLTFNLQEQMFQMNNCAKLFWNPCINVEVMAWWPFYHLTFKYDLDLQPTWTNVLSESTSKGEQLCRIILTSMHKCRISGPDKLNLWPFSHLIFKCDFDLQPTWTNVSNGPSTPQGEQLCQIIFKSMHKCRSYGPDKLNLWPFHHLTLKCDLDLQPSWTNVSNGTSTPQGK